MGGQVWSANQLAGVEDRGLKGEFAASKGLILLVWWKSLLRTVACREHGHTQVLRAVQASSPGENEGLIDTQ